MHIFERAPFRSNSALDERYAYSMNTQYMSIEYCLLEQRMVSINME